MELGAHRTSGMAQNPISWADMAAWSKFTRTDVEPWEIRAICALDRVFMDWRNLTEDQRKAELSKSAATEDSVVNALRTLATPDPKRKPTKRKKSDG